MESRARTPPVFFALSVTHIGVFDEELPNTVSVGKTSTNNQPCGLKDNLSFQAASENPLQHRISFANLSSSRSYYTELTHRHNAYRF